MGNRRKDLGEFDIQARTFITLKDLNERIRNIAFGHEDDDIQIYLNVYGGTDDIEFDISYERPETPEEIASRERARIEMQAILEKSRIARLKNEEDYERKEYERLKEKYG